MTRSARAAEPRPKCSGTVAPRSQIVNVLSQRFAEVPAALGLAHDGSLVEVFTSPDSSTWTMVLTRPNGMSRIMVEGQAWIDVQPETGVVESGQ